MNDWILDVSALNEYVGHVLQADSVLRDLRIRGEISGFKVYPSGHWYFTLKDDRCRISCVMWRTNAMRMSFRPHDGDMVVLHGAVRLYEEGGNYQFSADSMRPEGVGLLYRRFEQLKAKLEAEGLFDPVRKRPLPIRPRKIAIVTSEAGAVLHDICKVSAARDPGVPLVLIPVPVQGEGAAPKIAEGIRLAAYDSGADVMIVGRGGGSMEDLWAFNEECVARAIATSPIPVISAVGHETDFTIADFVADVRASTPSNAAELAVPDQSELQGALNVMRRRFDTAAQNALATHRMRILQMNRRLNAINPELRLQQIRHRALTARARLDRLADDQFSRLPERLNMAGIRMDNAMDALLRQRMNQLKQDRTQLEGMNPMRVLERGYALVTDGKRLVTDAEGAPDHMKIRFHDGEISVIREKE